jgi:hypothetical protein
MRPLDDPDILQLAPDDVREERTAIILSRGGSVLTGGSNELIMPSERNLLEEGSGLMAGADAVAEAASQLNYTGETASQLFQLSANAAKRDEGRRRHMGEKEAAGVPDPETLQKRYQELPRLTANGIVAHGSGECDYAAFKNCSESRQKKREKKDAEAKKKRRQLQPHISKQSKKPSKSWPTTTTRRAASQFLSSRHSANFTRRRETSESQPRGTTYSQDFGSTCARTTVKHQIQLQPPLVLLVLKEQPRIRQTVNQITNPNQVMKAHQMKNLRSHLMMTSQAETSMATSMAMTSQAETIE